MNQVGRLLRLFVLFLGVAGASICFAVPKILVIQLNHPVPKDGGDPNVPITDAVATELEQGGKVSTITWGILDPSFRAAVMDGHLKGMADSPTLATATEAAKTLGAEYILVCRAKRVSGSIKADGQLLRGGKSVWQGETNLKITTFTDDVSQNDTLRSVARTLAVRIQSEGLKILVASPLVETQPPAKGLAPPVVPVVEPVASPVKAAPSTESADAQWLTEAKAAASKGFSSATILMLRDGIDQRPTDSARRRLLIETLLDADPRAAAEEARRAAILFPEETAFRGLAARSWMRAGDMTQAQLDLNDAVAHHADDASTLLLLVEVSLQKGDIARGLDHATQAVTKFPSTESFFLRALCRALLGGTAGVRLDLEELSKAKATGSDSGPERHFGLAVRLLDRSMEATLLDVKSLLQKVGVDPKSAEAADQKEQSVAVTDSRLALLEWLKVPVAEKSQLARRVLAHKLLRQTLMDIGEYIGGSADALLDARINLGEAIKQLNLARNPTSPNSGGKS